MEASEIAAKSSVGVIISTVKQDILKEQQIYEKNDELSFVLTEFKR